MNWRNAGAISLVLFVPLILILLFRTGTTRLKELPIFGEKTFVDGDSVEHRVNFSKIIDLPDSFKNKHILLYLSENDSSTISEQAQNNLLDLALRLKNARKHPKDQVRDIILLSVSNTDFKLGRPFTWHQIKANSKFTEFLIDDLSNGFDLSETPLQDHMAFLIDADSRVRGCYFAAHGKFNRDVMGEMMVLRNEYKTK